VDTNGETPESGSPLHPADMPASEESGIPLLAIVLMLCALLALVALAFLVDPLRETVKAALHGDTNEVRRRIDDLGWGGPPIVLALCLLHAVLLYPAEIVDAAAGFAYGFWLGLPLVLFGWLLNGFAAYGIGRGAARPILWRLVGRERFERAEKTVERGGVTLLLTVRLVPILPFSLVCYAAGAARVPLWRFAWTTAVGYLPITALSVYLGTRLEDFSVTDPLVLISLAALLTLVFAAHWIIPSPEPEPEG
jgi:uncharacterized membrane protein YdjX (TVP38/TMEM64 family)